MTKNSWKEVALTLMLCLSMFAAGFALGLSINVDLHTVNLKEYIH